VQSRSWKTLETFDSGGDFEENLVSQLAGFLPDWQRAYGSVETTARIRLSCEDFQVTELLGFEPQGDGEHDYLWIEKEGQNTVWVAGLLAKFAGIRESDVGFSGLKDRHAVTRQWFSVRRPGGIKPDWNGFGAQGVRILETARHGRKLRRGAHRANRFRIVLRELPGQSPALAAKLALIREQGVPNYFGEQRFGHEARNLRLAEKLFAGRRLPRNQRSIALSAARSYLFNLLLAQRVCDDTWNRLLPGDLANLDGSGSVFAVDAVDDELAARADRLDLHPTGPLWGSDGTQVSGDVASLEQSVIDRHAELARGLESQRVEQSRRALRVRAAELTWHVADERTLSLEFTLGRGSFATALLRELVRPIEAAGETIADRVSQTVFFRST
jgi:tRNA pseudouridine13 synthase